MKTRALVVVVGAIWGISLGCNEDKKTNTEPNDDVEVSDTVSDDGEDNNDSEKEDAESDGEKDCGSTVAPDQMAVNKSDVAIDENFDDWEAGDCRFSVSNGDPSAYPDSGTQATIDGRDCLAVHAAAGPNGGYGYVAEMQLMLDGWTDMSNEDFSISFDLYVPADTHRRGVNVQYSFWETANFTPIYSKWWSSSIIADQWVTITSDVKNSNGEITFSNFIENPEEWQFNAVRVQLIANGAAAAEGDELLYYVDNLVVRRNDAPDTEDTETGIDTGDTETADTDAASGLEVTIDGSSVPVTRMADFAVPVNYVQYDYAGEPLQVAVSTTNDIGDYHFHPKSQGMTASLSGNRLSFAIDGPKYLSLDIEGQERLFLLIDPAETTPPKPGDPDVTDIMDIEGMDNTGQTEVTAMIQSAIDAASGAERRILFFPEGEYLTNTIYLKDDMTMYLAKGAVLKNAADQAELLTHPDGLDQIELCSRGLIIMAGVANAKLMGRGAIDGNGARLQPYERKMFLVKIENSRDCVVEGIVSRDSCFWNTLIYRSENISISNYKVINNQPDPSSAGSADETWNETDGVDFDNCVNSTLYNAFLYTGDDCMAVKSDDVPDDIPAGEFTDPSVGAYLNVSGITHEKIVCDSGSSAAKVGTKTFGETMSNIVFRDVDVINALRALVIDAVDTANIDGTVFEDIRIENVTGDLIDFNMDPEEIDWRANRGTCTITNTSVVNVSAEKAAPCHIEGNIHDYNENDPYYGNEYYVDGVTFTNFSIDGNIISSMDDENVTFITQYAENISFTSTSDN